MTRTHTLHATTREWTDAQGNKHKHRIEVGAIFQCKNGRLVVKLDAMPITKEFSGWLATVEVAPPIMPPGRRASPGMPPPPPPHDPSEPDPDHDVPF